MIIPKHNKYMTNTFRSYERYKLGLMTVVGTFNGIKASQLGEVTELGFGYVAKSGNVSQKNHLINVVLEELKREGKLIRDDENKKQWYSVFPSSPMDCEVEREKAIADMKYSAHCMMKNVVGVISDEKDGIKAKDVGRKVGLLKGYVQPDGSISHEENFSRLIMEMAKDKGLIRCELDNKQKWFVAK